MSLILCPSLLFFFGLLNNDARVRLAFKRCALTFDSMYSTCLALQTFLEPNIWLKSRKDSEILIYKNFQLFFRIWHAKRPLKNFVQKLFLPHRKLIHHNVFRSLGLSMDKPCSLVTVTTQFACGKCPSQLVKNTHRKVGWPEILYFVIKNIK